MNTQLWMILLLDFSVYPVSLSRALGLAVAGRVCAAASTSWAAATAAATAVTAVLI